MTAVRSWKLSVVAAALVALVVMGFEAWEAHKLCKLSGGRNQALNDCGACAKPHLMKRLKTDQSSCGGWGRTARNE